MGRKKVSAVSMLDKRREWTQRACSCAVHGVGVAAGGIQLGSRMCLLAVGASRF